MKKLIAASIVASSLGLVSSNVMAVNIDGIEFDPGAIFEIGTVYEDIVPSVGGTLDGIGTIDVIRNSSNTITWLTGQNGRELTFAFDGFILEAVVPNLNGAELLWSGGFANFYSDSAQDFTVNSGQAADLASATNGDLWLTLDADVVGTCGAGAFAGVGCLNGAVGITLTSQVDTSVLASVSDGSGSAFFSVNAGAGSANGNFDTNGLPLASPTFDFSAEFSFNNQFTTDYDLSGSVDIRANAIPEPSTLGMLGLGLLAVGLSRRRKI